jgi:outer membrane protein
VRSAGLRLSGFALLLALATSPGVAAQAQRLPQTIAAVVDFQKIMADSKAARSINDQIDARRQTYLDELSREEQRLYEVDKQLARQRALLAPEAFAEQRRTFEAEVQSAQRLSQERRRQLEAARTEALGEVRKAVVEVVDELAKNRGFNLVLPSSAVLLFAPDLDLTEQVMTRLDARLPSVAVPEKLE